MAATRNFADVIRRKLELNPDLAAAVEKESFNAGVAEQVYHARKAASLTQKQLAEMIGTHQSVIARLESADYDGHSLTMLQKIATALNAKLRVVLESRAAVRQPSVAVASSPIWDARPAWTPTIIGTTIDATDSIQNEGLAA